MPKLTRVSATQAQESRVFDLAQQITSADYGKVKDAWINRSGILYYAGYWQHEESAKLLGYDSVEHAENAGWIHISSCFSSTPQVVHMPRKITNRQYDTLADYCEAHKIVNPALQV